MLYARKIKKAHKINFINMWSKASKIKVKTCKCFFPKRSVEKLLLSNVARVSRKGSLLSVLISAVYVIFL